MNPELLKGLRTEGPILAGLAGIYAMHDPLNYGFTTEQVTALVVFAGMIGAGIRSLAAAVKEKK